MTTQNNTVPPKHRKSRASRIVLVLLLLIIISGIAFLVYTNRQLSEQIQRLNTAAITLQQQETSTKTLLDSAFKTLQSKHTKLNHKLSVINKVLSSALQERWYQNNDWLMLKARYYLELAEINAHWSDNTQTTVALFQQADDLLSKIHDPQIFSVRQALALEITQQQAVPTLDTAGLLARLDAAQQLITHLPSKTPLTLTKNTPSADTKSKSASIWQDHLKNSLQYLEKLVIIRHQNEPTQPLLTTGYEALLRETIRLNLQESQWAVIQRNQPVYQLSLTQAIGNIKRGFDLKAEPTQTLIKQLQDLQVIQLNTKKLTPGQSLLLLNQVIGSKKDTSPLQAPVAGEHP